MITKAEHKAIQATNKHAEMLRACGQRVTAYERYALSRMFLRLMEGK